MKATFSYDTSEENIVEAVKGYAAEELLSVIFLGEEHTIELNSLVDKLNAIDAPFIGGVFPQLIKGTHTTRQGVVHLGVKNIGRAGVIRSNKSESDDANDLALNALITHDELCAYGRPAAVLVLVEAFSSSLHIKLDNLYDKYGTKVQYFGGGSGLSSLEQAPTVFGPQGAAQDALAVAIIEAECKLGVAHGWTRVHGPVVVTRTEGSAITELNWRPAFEVYRELLESLGTTIEPGENFYKTAIAYPFGMSKEGSEDLVRDPIRVTETGGIIFAAPVPNHSVLYLLTGTDDSLALAAEEAVKLSHLDDSDLRLVIDCESRSLFLGENFKREVSMISAASSLPTLGITSFGEISSIGDGLLEMHNKTTVIASLKASQP